MEFEGQVPIKKILCIYNMAQTIFPASFLLPKDCSYVESDQSPTTFTLLLPFRGSLIIWHRVTSSVTSPAPWSASLSCHCGLVKHAPSQELALPFPLSVRHLPQIPVASFSLPSDLCSNVTPWERPFLTTQSKTAFCPHPLHLLILFTVLQRFCYNLKYSRTCWSSLSLGWELGPSLQWLRNFEH